MRNITTVTLTLSSMLALAGCATTNDVLFVTKTSLGIDFDAKPASASIAYDRTEGYIAPRYDNGEIPPVVASIRSDGAIFSPEIRQVYATGDAAVIAVSNNNLNDLVDSKKKLQGEKKLMFFGTTTTTGLKVGFTTYIPDSFVFGFKRKEYSFIPLGTQKEGESTYDVYPSVLASIDTAAKAGELKQPNKPESATTQPEADASKPANPDPAPTPAAVEPDPDNPTSLSNAQYFATGRAARELAANPAIRKVFIDLATKSLRAPPIPVLAPITEDQVKLVKKLTVAYGNLLVEHPSDETKSVPKDDTAKKKIAVALNNICAAPEWAKWKKATCVDHSLDLAVKLQNLIGEAKNTDNLDKIAKAFEEADIPVEK